MRKAMFWAAAACMVAVPASGRTQGQERGFSTANASVSAGPVTYKGRAAVRVADLMREQPLNPLVLVPATGFRNGVIEADVAGLPAPGAPEGSRGFIGIAFRVQPDGSRYEAFYIRPTNGRADDQLRRNHATQYISAPDHPWQRLRKEHPGVYESYADMQPGEWTRLRIEVEGSKARLYVGGTEQPALIVNDLKLGAGAEGGVALWVGSGTDGYFSNVKVTKRPD